MGDHWMTSGRSRLRAKQKRGFAWRAQKRASVTRPDAFYNPPPRPSNQPRGDHPSRPKKASECKWGGDGKKGFFFMPGIDCIMLISLSFFQNAESLTFLFFFRGMRFA